MAGACSSTAIAGLMPAIWECVEQPVQRGGMGMLGALESSARELSVETWE